MRNMAAGKLLPDRRGADRVETVLQLKQPDSWNPRRDKGKAGALHHDKMNATDPFANAVPFNQCWQLVTANYPKQMTIRVDQAKLIYGLTRITWPLTIEFPLPNAKLRLPRNSQLKELQPLNVTKQVIAGFKRITSCRYKNDFAQIELCNGSPGHLQMPHMDRIKGPTKKSQPPHCFHN